MSVPVMSIRMSGDYIMVVTIVGGGVFAPRLCEALAKALDIPELELRLTARRPERLRVIAHQSAARLALQRPGWSVQGVPSLEAALENASVVILLVRVGGLEARAWDEEFPRRFGLVGDEGLGPGGIANAWRTVPELARIADVLRRVSPEARVINLMAPLGITTRLLLARGLAASGVCELPLVTLESWMAHLKRSLSSASWCYGGLNHLGWFWNVRVAKEDVLRLLADAQAPGDPGPVDRSTIDAYQAAPLRYFYEIFDREAGRRLGLERPPNRARQLRQLSETLIQRFSSNAGVEVGEEVRPTPWLDRAVAPITAAFLGGSPHRGFVNLRNGDHLPGLPPELVVEVAATYTSSGASSVVPGPLPKPVSRFLGRVAEVEMLTFRAAHERDPGLLDEAMKALPLPIAGQDLKELVALAQVDPPPQEHR
jgi:6-phospho-beta-glucosidase